MLLPAECVNTTPQHVMLRDAAFGWRVQPKSFLWCRNAWCLKEMFQFIFVMERSN